MNLSLIGSRACHSPVRTLRAGAALRLLPSNQMVLCGWPRPSAQRRGNVSGGGGGASSHPSEVLGAARTTREKERFYFIKYLHDFYTLVI